MTLPSGPGTPAPDAADALAQATKSCRSVSTMTAEVGITGSVGGNRLRARLLVGLAKPASARLEAFAFSQQVFIFAARADEATLYLTRERRVLERETARDVLEAITGVPLDAAGLRMALTGCTEVESGAGGRQLGDDWRVVSASGSDLYVHRQNATSPWQLVAESHHDPGASEWRTEYRDFQNGLPRDIRLASLGKDRFDLRLVLSQLEVNMPLDAAAFQVRLPADADPITLDELREGGPLSNDR
jgi:hypothetical protein